MPVFPDLPQKEPTDQPARARWNVNFILLLRQHRDTRRALRMDSTCMGGPDFSGMLGRLVCQRVCINDTDRARTVDAHGHI